MGFCILYDCGRNHSWFSPFFLETPIQKRFSRVGRAILPSLGDLLIQLYLFAYGLPRLIPGLNLGIYMSGLLALALNSSAYVAEIIRSRSSGRWSV